MDRTLPHLRPHTLCVICWKELIMMKDLVVAFLSKSESYFGRTRPFYIPPHGHDLKLYTVRPLNTEPVLWIICRRPGCWFCSQCRFDFFLCHYTCLLTLVTHVYKRYTIDSIGPIICETASFFNPWPLARTDYDICEGPSISLNDSPPGNGDALRLFKHIEDLSAELQDMIQIYCEESELWKIRRTMAWPLGFYAAKHETRYISEVGNWKRGLGFIPKSTGKFVLLGVDSMGIKEVEVFENQPIISQRSTNVWYTILETSTAGPIRAILKDGRMRLDQKPANLVLWDTPLIPGPCRLYGTPTKAKQLRLISLKNLVGLTFFVSNGLTYAVHPHYDSAKSALETFLQIPRWRREHILWLFLPVAQGIESLWLRTLRQADGQVLEPSLLFKTRHGTILDTGFYHEDSASTYACRCLGQWPTALIHSQPNPGEPILTFGAIPSTQITRKICALKYNLSDAMDLSDVDLYSSEAPLYGVAKIKLFLNKTEACRGILLSYQDGKQQALGQLRDDLICREFDSPVGFHFRNRRGCVHICITQRRNKMNDVDSDYQTVDLANEKQQILWLFNLDFDRIILLGKKT